MKTAGSSRPFRVAPAPAPPPFHAALPRTPALAAALALLLAVLPAACGRDAPTTPAATGPGGRVALQVVFPQGAAATVDTIEASVFVGGRRIAGPVDTMPDRLGRYRLSLPAVPAGPGRLAAVRVVAHGPPTSGSGPGPGTWYLGLSAPFTLVADDTASAAVTLAPFTTVFTVDQSSFIGSAPLRWRRVNHATGYRVREIRANESVVDRTAGDTTLVVAAETDGATRRTFEVRAESPYAAGAWSATLTITIVPETPPPSGNAWEALDQGQTVTPGARLYHAGAFDAASRTLYVFGGLGANSQYADSLLWGFSLAGGTWTKLSEGVKGGPGPRIYGCLAVSPDGHFVYLLGGLEPGSTAVPLDLWRFDTSARRWSRLATAVQGIQAGVPGEAGIDGFIWVAPATPGQLNLYSPETAEVFTFTLDGQTWSRGPTSDQWVPERFLPACVYNPTGPLLETYGGSPVTGNSQPDSSLWVQHWAEGGRWDRPPYGSGPKPPSRQMASLALRDNGHLVLFGGIGPFTGQIPVFDDVWEFTPAMAFYGGTWSQVNAGNTIGVRFRPTLGYDPTTHRLITFGGLNNSEYAFVWALTLQ